jgi:hypothetical protein
MSIEKTDDNYMVDPFQPLDAWVAEIDRLETARLSGQTLEFESMEHLRTRLIEVSGGLFDGVEWVEQQDSWEP